MLTADAFRRYGYQLIDWVADYLDHADRFPVLPATAPGEIKSQLPDRPPEQGEPMDDVLKDFHDIILPGVTHWNHPRFFAYFPANNSAPSILAELLSAALGVNGMVWQSCPAATELEEQVMDWLRQMLALPEDFRGVIQDTASTATLCALLCARERLTGFKVNQGGFSTWPVDAPLRVYASSETHSSIEKGAKIAGFGKAHVVKVAVDAQLAMDPADLAAKIEADRAAGMTPCCVVGTVGTTSSTALDSLAAIGRIAKQHDLWFHVDAALAGSAAILQEKRAILDGVEGADSFVFNPHKWLFTNFDCSAYFCRDPELLKRTFAIHPEYLKTGQDAAATNFRDWGIPLGRRFRALKLWFVIRSYGVEGLRARLRAHLAMTQDFKRWVDESRHFQVLAPVPLNTVCFRFNPGKNSAEKKDLEGASVWPEEKLAKINQALMDDVNGSGRIFITHTKLDGKFCLRMAIGQTGTEAVHVKQAWEVLCQSQVVRQYGSSRD